MKAVPQYLSVFLFLLVGKIYAQPCTPLGDQITYGTGNVWIGYVYDNLNFAGYNGYVNEGTAGNSNFDESFGGDNVNYTTNGCPTYTETFSVRYKLTQNFSDGDYEFTVGADDGFRLSLDGGTTWSINQWNDQSYTTASYTVHLSGSYNMILEYYENGGGNRISFNVQAVCVATGDQTIYGTGNVWNGYIYDGTNFNVYKGAVTEGNASYPDFDEGFGGSNTTYSTSSCATQTETFSARYRLRKNFITGSYIFIVGGDDGYRLSLDGGSTWVINKWNDQGYNTTGYSATLSGSHDLVIEYYENGGDNRISFSLSGSVLPINLISFSGERKEDKVLLNWETASNTTVDHFEIERSIDNNQFSYVGQASIAGAITNGGKIKFTFFDNNATKKSCFYRIKMIDLSGVVTYSKIISFLPENLYSGIHVYPTLSEGNIFITSAEKLKNPCVILYDLAGRKVFEKALGSIPANTPFALSVSANGERKGVYLLQVSDNNLVRETKKIILN